MRLNRKDGAEPATQAALEPAATDVRGDTLNRIRQSLVTSRLTLATDTSGGNPYDSGSGRSPGSVWGQRRR